MGMGIGASDRGAAGQTGGREGYAQQPTFWCAPLTRRATLCAGKRRGDREISAFAGWIPPMDGVICLREGISRGLALYLGAKDGYRCQWPGGSGADGRQGGIRAATDIRVRPFDPAGDALRRRNAAAAEKFLRLPGRTPPMDGVICLREGISRGLALYLGAEDGYRRQRSGGSGADGRQGGMCADARTQVPPFDPAGDALRRKNTAAVEKFLRSLGADAPDGWGFCLGEGISCGQALCFGAGGTGTSANGRGSGADGKPGGMHAATDIRVRPFDPPGDALHRKTPRRQRLFCACRVDAPDGWGSLPRGRDFLRAGPVSWRRRWVSAPAVEAQRGRRAAGRDVRGRRHLGAPL